MPNRSYTQEHPLNPKTETPMDSAKYTKIPTAHRQLIMTATSLLFCIVFFYFYNPDAQLSAEMKRFMNRAGATAIMAGGILGAFGLIWAKKSAKNRYHAEQDLRAYIEAMRRLTHGGQDATTIAPVLAQLEQNMADIATEKVRASSFDETVVNVGIGALAFLVVGTILQVLAA